MAMIYSNDAWLVNGSTWPLWISHLLWPMERITSCWFKFRMLNMFLSSILKVNIQICEPWTFYQFYHISIISLSWHIMYEHCCLCPASLLASSHLRVNPLVDAMVEGWQLANACFFVRELNAGVLQTFKFGSLNGRKLAGTAWSDKTQWRPIR